MHPFDAKNVTVGRKACLLLLLSILAHAGAGVRIVESVLPALSYGQSCWSTVDLQNLGDRVVIVEIEGHRSTGALVPLAGRPGVKGTPPCARSRTRLATRGTRRMWMTRSVTA